MCLCSFEKRAREEVITLPNRPVLQTTPPLSISQNRRSLSVLPSPRSSAQPPRRSIEIEPHRLSPQDRVVFVETISPRSSNPTRLHQSKLQGSGSLHGRSPRHSSKKMDPGASQPPGGTIITPGLSFSSNEVQNAVVLRPPTRSRSGRRSAASYRSPRQSNASFRSTSHRSTREKMVEVGEEDGRLVRREYERRDDSRW